MWNVTDKCANLGLKFGLPTYNQELRPKKTGTFYFHRGFAQKNVPVLYLCAYLCMYFFNLCLPCVLYTPGEDISLFIVVYQGCS